MQKKGIIALVTKWAIGCLVILSMEAGAQIHVEAGGIVMIEAESAAPGIHFTFEDTIPGFEGTGYLRARTNAQAGQTGDALDYRVLIRESGRYQLAMRSRIGAGDKQSDHNDCWIRLLDPSGNPITPVANGNVATGTWYKVYMNFLNLWAYQTSNKDHDPRSLSWALEAGKEYRLQLSSRSVDHLVDQLILWETGQHDLADKVKGSHSTDFAALSATPVWSDYIAWAGYIGDEAGNVDTGSFLGWLNASQAPWVWIYTLERFAFAAEDSSTTPGGYFYFPR